MVRGGSKVIIRWEHGHDYLLVHLHQDMLGDWVLSRAWGQKSTRFGGLRHDVAETREQALTWINDLDHIHRSRGFHKVLETSEESSAGQQALKLLEDLQDA
ncbi:hypothetical protein [Carnimonas bestiolae]|uniref:hypothetical protein n=1 Tax=Carnimonas bestiolae TaxID=3402172 RepID=UPI003EDBB4B8